MGTRPFKKQGREPTARRVVVQLRAAPEAFAHLLAHGKRDRGLDLKPWSVHGYVLLTGCYVRRGRVGRFLARERLTWILAGKTFDAGGPSRHFEHAGDRFSFELTVSAGDVEELYLAAESCANPSGSVFASTREAADYLERTPETRADAGRAWEPLDATQARWFLLGFPDALSEALEFDSAFRQVARRVTPISEHSERAHPEVQPRPLPSP